MMAQWDRFSQETRYLLDVVSFAVLQHYEKDRLSVHAALPELFEDLSCRVSDRVQLIAEGPGAFAQTGVVHLLTVEQGLSEIDVNKASFVVVAFRNQWSLKSLRYGKARSLIYRHVVHQMTQAGMQVRSWGVYTPVHLGWYQVATLADRFHRYDIGFHLRDRGALAPVTETRSKRWANFCVVLGVRNA